MNNKSTSHIKKVLMVLLLVSITAFLIYMYYKYINGLREVRLHLDNKAYEFELEYQSNKDVYVALVNDEGNKVEGSEKIINNHRLSIEKSDSDRELVIYGFDINSEFVIKSLNQNYLDGNCKHKEKGICKLNYEAIDLSDKGLVFENKLKYPFNFVIEFIDYDGVLQGVKYHLNPNKEQEIEKIEIKNGTNIHLEEASLISINGDKEVAYVVKDPIDNIIYYGNLDNNDKKIDVVQGKFVKEDKIKKFVNNNKYLKEEDKWVIVDKKLYHLDQDGNVTTGVFNDNGKLIGLNEEGLIKKGWLKDKDKTYYLNDDGSFVKGLNEIDGKKYYFDEKDYYLITNQTRWIDDEYYFLSIDGIANSIDDYRDVISKLPSGRVETALNGYVPSADVIEPIRNAVNYFESGGHQIGYIILDLDTLKCLAYNADLFFYSASSIKSFYSASLAYYNPEGARAWENVIREILITSDNELYASLYQNFGSEYIARWLKDAKVENVEVPNYYTWYSLKDFMRLWLRNYQFFTDGEYGEYVGTWWEHAKMSYARLQLNWMYPKMQTKMGYIGMEGLFTTCEGAIIYADHPYLMVYMTSKTVDEKTTDWDLAWFVSLLDFAYQDMWD